FGKWELVGLLSALFSGVAVTAMRAARRGENSWAVYTSFCLFGLIVNAPMGIAQWKAPLQDEWMALAATSLLAIGAQLTIGGVVGVVYVTSLSKRVVAAEEVAPEA